KKFYAPKIIGIIVAFTILISLFSHYNLLAYLSIDGFNHYNQQILTFEQHHIVEFTIVYLIAYVLLIACCLPGTILFDLLAGFIYGTWLGLLIVLFGYVLGSIANFVVVRYLFCDFIHRKFAHLREVVLGKGSMSSIIMNLIALRFIPIIPFWLLNILAAILEIPLPIFGFTTLIGILPTALIYIFLGVGVREHLQQHQQISLSILTDPKLWAPLLILTLLIIIPNLVKRYRKRRANIS
ncbi:MAG: hypothetical protein RLZZ293_764, partial [Pseudomonadota bacterium]